MCRCDGRSFCGRGSDTNLAVRDQQKARQAFLGVGMTSSKHQSAAESSPGHIPAHSVTSQTTRYTKEIRIIQDIGIWKVINHEGRTLDATRTRAEAEESVAILEQFPEYRGRWP